MLHFSYIFVTFAVVMEQLKEKYEQFKEWQLKPHEVGQLTADKHICATCHTEFHGNYCPRCGQKSTIGRYSFKTAFLTFLDVWGLGNRGMFRTIRDLLFRPGYMIRDYLNGMQMAYFPPFKMFFLVVALLVLVNSGFNIKMQIIENYKEKVARDFNESLKIDDDEKTDAKTFNEVGINDTNNFNGKPVAINKDENSGKININQKVFDLKSYKFIDYFINWVKDNKTISQFLLVLVLSLPMYLFFRHNKMIPDLRYSEFFVSIVYVTNLITIVQIIGNFFLPGYGLVDDLAYILSIITLKQLYGYNYKQTILRVIGAFALLGVIVVLIACFIGGLAYLYFEYIL